MRETVADLLPEAQAIGRYYGNLVGYLHDELEAAAIAALGEAALRYDASRGLTFDRYAHRVMHHRCRDTMRQWVRSRGGMHRTVPVGEWYDETLPAVTDDDTEEWVWECVTEALAEAQAKARPRGKKNPGQPSAHSFEVIALWFSLGSVTAAAAALGTDPSRISQVMRQVADAIRPVVWQKLSA